MNSRELSEKLDELATRIEDKAKEIDYSEDLKDIAAELRILSNQNYAPGNSLSWDAVKPKPVVKTQGGFISKTGKKMPF